MHIHKQKPLVNQSQLIYNRKTNKLTMKMIHEFRRRHLTTVKNASQVSLSEIWNYVDYRPNAIFNNSKFLELKVTMQRVQIKYFPQTSDF